MIDIYFTIPTPCWTHDIHIIYDNKFQNNLSNNRTQDQKEHLEKNNKNKQSPQVVEDKRL